MAKKKIDIKEIALAVLCFRKGYRVLSFFFWFFLLGLISIPIEYASKKEYQQQAEDRNYQRRCAEGDFVGARAIRDELYTSYTKKLGQWRSGEWCDHEAIQRQEIYRAAAAYIFGQEMTAIYASEAESSVGKLVSMILSIPSEGAPLAEGRYSEGMFYDCKPAIGVTLAIDHSVYQSWVRFYNDRCEQVLELALASDDKQLARRVAKLYKVEIVTRFEADPVKGREYNIAVVSYDNSRRNAAIKRSLQ